MTPWHCADGTVGGVLLFIEVITARKAADAALAESEARFRVLAESMPHMIYTASPAGVTEYKNQRWFEYSGQTPDQARGSGWVAMLHPDDRQASLIAWDQAIATGHAYERQHRLRGKDGRYRWFLSRATPLRAPDNGPIIRWLGTSTDISDLVRAREVTIERAASLETQVTERTRALTAAAVELQAEMRRRHDMQSALLQSQKLEALGQLTAGVAHDFNNVLVAVQGSFELIEHRTTDPKLLGMVTLGKNATNRATSLTRKLLDFSRSDDLVPTVLDVEQAIRQADEMIGHAVGSSIMRSQQIQPDVWPVLTDGHQLEIALLNLAINARDAMPEGGQLTLAARNLAPHERPEFLPFQDYVSISVQDKGCGMPPDVLARATEPFFTTKTEGKGTGLGLPMVHAFALRSGGCVRIDSRQGIGTTVQIVLPRASVIGMNRPDAAPGETPPAGLVLDSTQQTGTILVVEDDEQVRQITVSYLRDHGYRTIDAPNLESAIVLSHSVETLDLLVTDVALPCATGPDLARRLRAERPNLPVLFITGNAAHKDLVGEHVLTKPFTGTDLVQAIARRIRGARDGGTADGGLVRRLRNPALLAAYLFWRAARNGGLPPRLTDLDWGGLPDAEHTFTVAVERDGDSVAFRYLKVGQALTARLGSPLDGSSITADLLPDPDDAALGSLANTYRRCTRTFSPSYEYARHEFGHGEPVLFERLVLPISDDGATVTHLVGIALFSGDS